VRSGTKSIALEIGERQLPNGLTLLAVRNPGVSTFAAGLMLDVDVRDEESKQAGLAHLVGECLDEGTAKNTSLEIADQLDRLGATLEVNAAGAGVHCPAEASRKAVGLLAEVVFDASFPAREMRRVQQEVLAEIQADTEDPRTVASLRFRKQVYGRHPYGRPARGTLRTVASYDPPTLRKFHRRLFVPDRGYAAACGPDEVEKTLDMLERCLAKRRGTRPARKQPAPPAMPAEASDLHLSMKREQVHVFLGHPGIRRSDPDFYALSVMDHILGTGPGFTSRISRKLRDEMGLCYSVDAAITTSAREEPGCFAAYIGTSPEHRQRAIDGFLAEMRRIRDTLPTKQELADVQEYLTGSFVWQLERNAALARYAIRAKLYDLGFDYIDRYPKLIRSVTRDDVRRVAREHLDPDRVVVVSAGAS
jgi:zinc protease